MKSIWIFFLGFFLSTSSTTTTTTLAFVSPQSQHYLHQQQKQHYQQLLRHVRSNNDRSIISPTTILSPTSSVRTIKPITAGMQLKSSSSSSSSATTTNAKWYQPLVWILSGPSSLSSQNTNETQQPQRPDWAREWMPTWLVTLRPTTQLVITILLYIFHLVVLTQHSIPFPCQLIPNERGHFQSIGLDSLAGMITLVIYQYFRQPALVVKETKNGEKIGKTYPPTVPPLLSSPRLKDSPWKNIYKSKYSRFTSFLAFCALFQAYFWTGRFSLWWEDTFYVLANYFPITVAMHRSLCVLFGHLSWIFMGGTILRLIPRPQNFFHETWYKQQFLRQSSSSSIDYNDHPIVSGETSSSSSTTTTTINNNSTDVTASDVNTAIANNTTSISNEDTINSTNIGDAANTRGTTTTNGVIKSKTNKKKNNNNNTQQWVWWTIGGYFVSSWFFNIADFINQWVLPISILEQAQESVVSQLINPENNDWLASFVGYIAPCLTAPWWEEVLYRGFLLPALILNMKYKWAIFWSGIIFSIHHVSPTACIPLTILGWTWSILYAKSGNLLTTILVHAMWNTRIFLGSWLGL